MSAKSIVLVGLAVVLVVMGLAVDVSDHATPPEPPQRPQPSQQQPSRSQPTEVPGMRGRGQLDEARWQEARTMAATIGLVLRRHYQQTGGYSGIGTGPVVEQAALGLGPAAFEHLRSFRAGDFRIVELRASDGYFALEVKGSLSHSPAGTLHWNSRNESRIDR